jgi:hypothetical protein
MAQQRTGEGSGLRNLYWLAMANAAIWATAMVALVFVINDYPGAKGMYPILGGGTAVAIALVSKVNRSR